MARFVGRCGAALAVLGGRRLLAVAVTCEVQGTIVRLVKHNDIRIAFVMCAADCGIEFKVTNA